MAMDDTLRLAQAILIDGEMACPDRVENMVPYGPWVKAKVHDSSIYVKHTYGLYFGTVRYSIDDGDLIQKTFHELLECGWTSIDFANQCIEAQAKEAKRKNRAKK